MVNSMTERFYQFSAITVRICAAKSQMYKDDGILSSFITKNKEFDYSLELQMVEKVDPPEGECVFCDSGLRVYRNGKKQIRYEGPVRENTDGAYLRVSREGMFGVAQLKRQSHFERLTPKTVLNCIEAEHLILQHSGFFLHASFIDRNGKAVLFTAPSGTGKSTQAELWCQLRGATQINGDRAAVRVASDGTVRADGVPYSGSSGICKNVSLPLEAVVYLTQSPETRLTPLFGVKAFQRIWEGCSVNTWNKEDVCSCSRTIMTMLTTVPVLHLACTPDESAVFALEQALEKLK